MPAGAASIIRWISDGAWVGVGAGAPFVHATRPIDNAISPIAESARRTDTRDPAALEALTSLPSGDQRAGRRSHRGIDFDLDRRARVPSNPPITRGVRASFPELYIPWDQLRSERTEPEDERAESVLTEDDLRMIRSARTGLDAFRRATLGRAAPTAPG